ncbi:MAG TPA: class I SAM-dependent methyltransferase [Candidatus Saccharimonadales bacterium]|nr:class I SAM-dependent methyltransferase [Candidatus Saccharimonadales bacterium]
MKRLSLRAKKSSDDQNTWQKDMEYTSGMQKRGRSMLKTASSICSWKSVIDIGCGNQQLKEVVESINPGAKYTGIDRLSHRRDTLIADFNQGEYPKVKADLAVVSGVLEYIQPEMVDRFLNNVCNTAPCVVISYFPTDYDTVYINKTTNPPKTRSELWVNQFKLTELIALFSKRDFQVEVVKRYRTSTQFILVFTKHA